MSRQVLHVDLDAFFVSVEQGLNPSLKGRPVVVGGDPGSRGVVACASYEARAYGLRAGMSLVTARRLCPQAIFLTGKFGHYQEASQKFFAILGHFTFEVEPLGIDEAYLDITGFEPLYGPPLQTARKIKERIRQELGLTASIGLAPCKVVAKVASDRAKPDGLLEIAPGSERAFLAPLPVGDLPGVGTRTQDLLGKLGVRTIGQLAELPLPLLHRLFGVMGSLLHRYANGLDDSPVEPSTAPAKSISRSTTFFEDTLERAFLRAVLYYLTERVGTELRQQGKRARGVVLRLRYADFQTISRHCQLKEPSSSDGAIFKAGLSLMEVALQQRAQKLRLIGIGVSPLVGEEKQLPLWALPESRWERLHRVVDRLRDKYGFGILQLGQTFPLRHTFSLEREGYRLHTACLSR